MSYQQPREQPTCKYCSTAERKTPIRFKKNELGKWLVFNMDGTEHTRPYCDEMKKKNQTSTVFESGKAVSISYNTGPSSTFSVSEQEPRTTGVTINSLFVKTSNLEKEVKELRKQIETSASVLDGMAQKIELILAKTGYPGPTLAEYKERAVLKGGKTSTELLREQGTVMGSKEEIPGLDKDLEEQADRLRKQQQVDQIKEAFSKTQEKISNELEEEPDYIKRQREQREKESSKGWIDISEAFVCNNCNTKTHNGFMKWGTKFCPECKTNVEAQQALEKINKEEDTTHHPLRTVEDINDDIM